MLSTPTFAPQIGAQEVSQIRNVAARNCHIKRFTRHAPYMHGQRTHFVDWSQYPHGCLLQFPYQISRRTHWRRQGRRRYNRRTLTCGKGSNFVGRIERIELQQRHRLRDGGRLAPLKNSIQKGARLNTTIKGGRLRTRWAIGAIEARFSLCEETKGQRGIYAPEGGKKCRTSSSPLVEEYTDFGPKVMTDGAALPEPEFCDRKRDIKRSPMLLFRGQR